MNRTGYPGCALLTWRAQKLDRRCFSSDWQRRGVCSDQRSRTRIPCYFPDTAIEFPVPSSRDLRAMFTLTKQMPNLPENGQTSATDGVEISPEMIEAGTVALWESPRRTTATRQSTRDLRAGKRDGSRPKAKRVRRPGDTWVLPRADVSARIPPQLPCLSESAAWKLRNDACLNDR